MGNWCSTQWNDIRGSAKFWLVTKIFGGGALVSIALAFVGYLTSLPAVYLTLIVLAALCLAIQIISYVVIGRMNTSLPNGALNTVDAPIEDLQIELIEHGESSSELLLECVNRGGPGTLTASLRVIDASPGLAYKNIGYRGTWVKPVSFAHNSVGVEYASTPSAYVETGGSGKLRMATIDAPQKPEGNAYMHLSGTDEWATWDLEHTAATDLPYFIVSVQIRAKGHNQVLKKTYKVGPPHKNESLRMVEYSACQTKTSIA